MAQKMESGFTLVELSIVLVIIGLIIGGVLVGLDLISAAAVRAQITQIEKYNTAVNTFRGKYGYIPGDIPDPIATQYGFSARGQYAGEGDGNGVLEGNNGQGAGGNFGIIEGTGETAMFWVDLSTAGLIEGGFSTANSTSYVVATGTAVNLYLPQSKLDSGNYIYVYSGIYCSGQCVNTGINYFGLSAVSSIGDTAVDGCWPCLVSTPNSSVATAYAIDKKIDDGYPQSGNVMAWYLNGLQYWNDGTGTSYTANEPVPYSGTLASSAATCYDNGNVAGATTQYSMGQNNGSGINCALSFKFQ